MWFPLTLVVEGDVVVGDWVLLNGANNRAPLSATGMGVPVVTLAARHAAMAMLAVSGIPITVRAVRTDALMWPVRCLRRRLLTLPLYRCRSGGRVRLRHCGWL